MGEHQRPSTMKGPYSCCVSTGLFVVLFPILTILTVNCSPAGQARSDEDAWLAVINSGSSQPQEPEYDYDPQARQDTELYQFEQTEGLGGQQQQHAQQPVDRFAQQPVPQQQPQQFQPQVPQQQRVPVQQPRVPQQQPRIPPPQQRAPQQRLPSRRPGPPRPGQRLPPGRGGPPRPGQGRPGFPGNRRKPTKPGLISGAIGAIGDGIGGVVKGAQCAASNFITDEKLKDEKFIRFQMDCALDLVQCDDIGKKIKILAPEVLAGRCPPPCNECTRKQIRKVMTELSQRYPGRF